MRMLRKCCLFLLLTAASVACGFAVAAAETVDAPEIEATEIIDGSDKAAAGKNLKVTITPYAWLTSISGTVEAKGHVANVDAAFTDLTKHLNFAGMLALEALAYNTWGVTGNVNAAMLGDDSSAKGVSLDSKSSMILSDLGLFWRFASTPLNDKGTAFITWDVLGGARIWDLEAKLTVRKGDKKRSVSQREVWADPIIGGRAGLHFTEDWGLELRADIGGFDVNAKTTWSASGVFAYSVWESARILFGYRAVGLDYKTGNGSDAFHVDATMHGPVVGMLFRF